MTAAGICSSNLGSSFLMLSTTATVLVPGCFCIASTMARSPLNQLADLVVLHAVGHTAEFVEPNRRSVAIGHDHGAELL